MDSDPKHIKALILTANTALKGNKLSDAIVHAAERVYPPSELVRGLGELTYRLLVATKKHKFLNPLDFKENDELLEEALEGLGSDAALDLLAGTLIQARYENASTLPIFA